MRATLRDAPVVVMPRGARPFVQPSALFAFVKRYPAQRQRDVFPRAAAPRAARPKDRRARTGITATPVLPAARRQPARGRNTPKTATAFPAPRPNRREARPRPV